MRCFSGLQHVNLQQNYIGIDIVDTVIEENIRRFETPRRKFLSIDAIVDDIPDADIVMCREVLFHLSFDEIKHMLNNILSKNRSYLIATSDRQTYFNSNIPTGDFRLLNLESWPIKFPAPMRVIDDSAVSPRRIIGVWDAKSYQGSARRKRNN